MTFTLSSQASLSHSFCIYPMVIFKNQIYLYRHDSEVWRGGGLARLSRTAACVRDAPPGAASAEESTMTMKSQLTTFTFQNTLTILFQWLLAFAIAVLLLRILVIFLLLQAEFLQVFTGYLPKKASMSLCLSAVLCCCSSLWITP